MLSRTLRFAANYTTRHMATTRGRIVGHRGLIIGGSKSLGKSGVGRKSSSIFKAPNGPQGFATFSSRSNSASSSSASETLDLDVTPSMDEAVARVPPRKDEAGDSERPEVLVNKLGGSSVGDAKAMRRSLAMLQEQAQEEGVMPVAVLSAMYGTTNRLTSALEHAVEGEKEVSVSLLESVFRRHVQEAARLLDGDFGPSTMSFASYVASMLTERKEILARIASRPAPRKFSVSEYALISGCGEYLSSTLFTKLARFHGLPCSMVDVHQSIVVEFPENVYPELTECASIDDTARLIPQSEINLEESTARLATAFEPLMAAHQVPVVPGFLAGYHEDGDPDKPVVPVTLGRGGSDLTASIVSNALDASSTYLWKVEGVANENGYLESWKEPKEQEQWTGVLSADPSKVDSAKLIEQLSYAEALELARLGRKVLHPETVTPVQMKDIDVYVCNLHVGAGKKTVIQRESTEDRDSSTLAKTIVSGPLQGGAANELTGLLGNSDSGVPLVPSSTSAVCIVGENIMDSYSEVFTRASDVLGDSDVVFLLPSVFNKSRHNMTLLVHRDCEEKAVRALHNAFCV